MFSSNTTQVSSGGYEIQRSLRFNSADTTYLSRTPASAGSRTTWTLSTWIKLSSVSTEMHLFGTTGATLWLWPDSTLEYYDVGTAYRKTTQVFRDVGAWAHLVVVWNSGNATASDRIRFYLNGQQITSFSASPTVALNELSSINNTSLHNLGRYHGGGYHFNGYLTEINFIDGQALTPSSFGEYNADTGVWGPKRYAGSYGTNGFYLNFSDNSNTTAATLGADYSGNGNNWTPNNFSVSAGAGNDSLVDVPTNWGVDTGVGGTVRGNYCTLNPLYGGPAPAPTNGNLDAIVGNQTSYGTMSFTAGKWYWEVTPTVASGDMYLGVMNSAYIRTDGAWGSSTARTYVSNGTTFGSGGGSYGASYTANDIIGIALDMDAGSITFYKNGTSQGTAFTNLGGSEWRALVYASGTSTFVCNFGQRPFAYTAPSGFKALNTQNLPTPTIGATPATQANKYFDVVLRNGGANTYSTTVNMANGAFLWDKTRNLTGDHYLVDSVRGISQNLSSNTTAAEVSIPNFYTNFGINSYTTGVNDWTAGVSLVDWIWAANGAGVTNTAGSITSTVSANTTSGFSVVTYTGNGTAGARVGHGLGAVPAMIIVKRRDATQDWVVYQKAAGVVGCLFLNDISGFVGTSNVFDGSENTSSVFSIYTAAEINASGGTYVAYCFAEVPGYSKFGSYTGNGSTDGAFVFTGFRPRYLMIKNSSGAGNWNIYDTSRDVFNQSDLILLANSSNAEGASLNKVDILSNGFKLRSNNSGTNGSGTSYIFAAFAESPQKFSLAR